jgi:hypothetical protein
MFHVTSDARSLPLTHMVTTSLLHFLCIYIFKVVPFRTWF